MPFNQKGIVHLFLLILLVIGIVIGIYLVQNPAIFKPKADGDGTPCIASDPASFRECLKAAETDEGLTKIEVTKQIVCNSQTECSSNGTSGGFTFTNRARPLSIYGAPGTDAGFKRTQNYDYILLTLGGGANAISDITLKDLVFDEGTTDCDFVALGPTGPQKCNSPLSLGRKINSSTIDNVTILNAKYHGLQVAQATNLTIKNSIIYNSGGDGIWFDGAYVIKRNAAGEFEVDCPGWVVCPIDESTISKNITIENNLIAESRIAGLELYTQGESAQNPSIVRGNLFIHNHRDARYVWPACDNGHCPGGQFAIARSKYLLIEDNVVRDSKIDSIKPYDQYNPSPWAVNKTYHELGLQSPGMELSSMINNITIKNNKIYNNSGNAIFADYIGPENQVDSVNIVSNYFYGNLHNFAGHGPSDLASSNTYGFSFAGNVTGDPSSGPQIKKAFIFSDPPVCVPVVKQDGQPGCESTIRWYSNDYPNLEVKVSESLFGSGANNNLKANWILPSGATFDLRDLSGATLAKTFVKGISQKATITAAPNPCTLNADGKCTSVISWTSENASDLQIKVGGTLVFQAPQGSQSVDWITANGATFEAFTSSDSRPLASLTVKGTGSGPIISQPSTAPTQPTATITANPTNCTLKADGTCTTTISWTSQNAPNLQIKVGTSTVAAAPQGSQVIPWITAGGATFEAIASPNTPPLTSLTVRGVTSSGTISATPCSIPAGQTRCTSAISWSAPNASGPVKIIIKETDSLFAQAGNSGSQDFPWVSKTPLTMQLMDGDNPNPLATVTVQATSIISAAPNPCTLTASQKCSTTITWNAPDIPGFDIYLKENDLIFDRRNTGSLDINFITATGATFQARSNGRVIDSVTIKGIR